jgi:hypothetical protein
LTTKASGLVFVEGENSNTWGETIKAQERTNQTQLTLVNTLPSTYSTLVPEALCEAKETRGEKEEPLVTSVANSISTLD